MTAQTQKTSGISENLHKNVLCGANVFRFTNEFSHFTRFYNRDREIMTRFICTRK